ncbi:p-cumate dioxygenase [Actinomadura sp. KC345]|uniref:aromatic-ring-hydroxylating dioxygenase subunit beta n=1 Tax=Actinomadura sp. KC345 TaxID=2530371 RepID=UPI00104C4A1B|nr:aromatic-ring-hydroxylating dioxygenase subunit beta [Actinomadura sp. KC345]TDC54763.1 p-cumate dioxygenase [Actinomadura sp. KC345]
MTAPTTGRALVGGREITRADVEDFLYAEADILDAWQYDDWLALFEPGARFEVPSTDWKGESPFASGSFVTDDWDLLRARVKRLKSRKAHAENPPSLTHRMISNVQLREHDEPGLLRVRASFIIHRARDGEFDAYVGRYDHLLVTGGDALRFRRRRAILAHEHLTAGSRLSFIL